jgi:hypothetical protein
MTRKKLVMEPIKIYVDPKLKKDLKMLAVEKHCSMSNLVSEILWSYVRMPTVKVPQVKLPERMAEKVADDAIAKAIQADEAELRPDPDTPVKDKLNYWKDRI